MEVFLNPDAWIALLTLTFLEIVLGIDNIIFISIATGKLPEESRKRATKIGMFLAMFMRIALLFGITVLIAMKEPWLTINFSWLSAEVSGQSIILLVGGLFLIYKSVTEMHSSVKGAEDGHSSKEKSTLRGVIMQIVIIDFIFSFDSVISAVGMTNDISHETHGNPLIIIVLAVIISMIVMLLFARPISDFINKRPTIKMIALGFLVTIGVMLIAESFGEHVQKGYIYFALVYSLVIEFLNIKMRKNKDA